MGLFDNNGNFGSEFRTSSGYRISAEVGSFMAGSVFRRVMGLELDVDSRIREAPIHDATLGVETLERGHKENDPELKHLGEAMIAAAIVRADESHEVPEGVVLRVVELANNNYLNPLENPLIGEDAATQVSKIIEKHL